MADADDYPTVRRLYRQMRVADLLRLQEAFTLDARETDSPICRVFCEARLTLIRGVLKEKAAARRRKGAPA
jgi:hypothetical protein